jgi:hypothetical protein
VNPPILDAMIAGPDEVDPTHIMALATRVKNLGEADDRLAAEFKELRAMLDKRLPTEDEITNFRAMLLDRAGRAYMSKQFKRWGLGGLTVLGTIYATRSYLSQILAWLASVLK